MFFQTTPKSVSLSVPHIPTRNFRDFALWLVSTETNTILEILVPHNQRGCCSILIWSNRRKGNPENQRRHQKPIVTGTHSERATILANREPTKTLLCHKKTVYACFQKTPSDFVALCSRKVRILFFVGLEILTKLRSRSCQSKKANHCHITSKATQNHHKKGKTPKRTPHQEKKRHEHK